MVFGVEWKAAKALEECGDTPGFVAGLRQRGWALCGLLREASGAPGEVKAALQHFKTMLKHYLKNTSPDSAPGFAPVADVCDGVVEAVAAWPLAPQTATVKVVATVLFQAATPQYNAGNKDAAAVLLDGGCRAWEAVIGRHGGAAAALLADSRLVHRLCVLLDCVEGDAVAGAQHRVTTWTTVLILACRADVAGLKVPPTVSACTDAVHTTTGAAGTLTTMGLPVSLGLPALGWGFLWKNLETAAGEVDAVVTSTLSNLRAAAPVVLPACLKGDDAYNACRSMLCAALGEAWDAVGDWRRARALFKMGVDVAHRVAGPLADALSCNLAALCNRVDADRGKSVDGDAVEGVGAVVAAGAAALGAGDVDAAETVFRDALEATPPEAADVVRAQLHAGLGRVWLARARAKGGVADLWTGRAGSCACSAFMRDDPSMGAWGWPQDVKRRRKKGTPEACAARCHLLAAAALAARCALPDVVRDCRRLLVVSTGLPGCHQDVTHADGEWEAALQAPALHDVHYLHASSVGMAARHEALRVMAERDPAGGGHWPLFAFDGEDTREVWQAAFEEVSPRLATVVVSATVDGDVVATRFRGGCATTLCVPGGGEGGGCLAAPLAALTDAMASNAAQTTGLTAEAVAASTPAKAKQWATARKALDATLRDVCGQVDAGLGVLRALLVGTPADGAQAAVDAAMDTVTAAGGAVGDVALFAAVVAAGDVLTAEEVAAGLAAACAGGGGGTRRRRGRGPDFEGVAAEVVAAAGGGGPRHPVVLVLGESLPQVPWENLPCLRPQAVGRLPGVPFVLARAGRLSTRRPTSAAYLLNPDGNLTRTQEAMEAVLDAAKDKGIAVDGFAGCCPPVADLLPAINAAEAYLYFGHGAGDAHLPPLTVASQVAPSVDTVVLMGCSSGRLRPAGRYEPSGTPLAYLCAGVGAVVANLWDVTDKDIDRFAGAMLGAWLGGDACLWDAVGGARGACRLEFLTAAAAVVYGVPHV